MNILSIGHTYFVRAWRDAGHNVVAVNFAGADINLPHPFFWQSLREKMADFAPDAAFYVDNGNFPMLLDPQVLPFPAIFYSIDTYCNPWHVAWAQGYDLVFSAQKDFVPLFGESGRKAQWLPLFAPEFGAAQWADRDIPIAFVGTLGHKNNPKREPFLNAFNKIQPLLMRGGDYRRVFKSARIVLNQTAFGEINFRCFEAMAQGAALLMERVENGLEEIFTPGENILPLYTRNNPVEAAAIARVYLDRPAELARIAANGYELVLKKHGAAPRAEKLLAAAKAAIASNMAGARLASLAARTKATRAAYAMIASELHGEQWQKYREFYFSLSGN